jgi:Ca-activated chloride channel family protein
MFNRNLFENDRPEGFAVLEIREPAPDGPAEGPPEPRRFVPLQRTELVGEIVGPLAALRLTQTFAYTRAQLDRAIEAVYRFPLPGDAAVTAVRVRFGEVEIAADLQERAQAEKTYDTAKREGRQAALATRESPDVFTLQVAGLQPDQPVTVETAYVQLARAEGAGWSLRVPLTTAPRYVRSDEAGSRPAQGQPLLLLRDPGHRFALDLRLPGATDAASPTHELDVERTEDGLRARLRGGEVLPDRDCVLNWQPRREDARPALQVWLHADPAAEEVYFLALASPPVAPATTAPREVILLVDHSGSMEGPKWEAADWAVKRFLSDLTPRDTFNLGLFHNTTRWFFPKPTPAGERAVAEAIAFLEAHRDSGGTELGVALEQALHQGRTEDERARHVLLVTDAEVSDAARILRLADAEARRDPRRRISLLCIDAAPNSFLALELAERGGGAARFLTSSPEAEDIATALDELLADWAAPVLTGLKLEVNRPRVDAAGRDSLPAGRSGWSAVDLGDLPAGRAVWVAGRVPRAARDELTLRLRAVGNLELAECAFDVARAAVERPALKSLFGARRVLGLEFLIGSGYADKDMREQLARLGYDPVELDPAAAKVYAENTRADAATALRPLLVREALAYGLASSETAFVAVRREAGKPVEGTVAVANALPAGWSESFLAAGAPMALAAAPMQYRGIMGVPPPSPAAGAPAARKSRLGGLFARASGNTSPPAAPADAAAFAAGPPVTAAPAPPLFRGVPAIADGEAVLFDSARPEDATKLPDRATFSRLSLRFPTGAPDAGALDPGLALLLFVDDLSAPRARMRLQDLVRQRGERPLNLRRGPGRVVRLVLADPTGAWRTGAPEIEVTLVW